MDIDRVTVDSPVPFCIHKLWFDFHQREHRTVIPKPGAGVDEVEPAYLLGTDGKTAQQQFANHSNFRLCPANESKIVLPHVRGDYRQRGDLQG